MTVIGGNYRTQSTHAQRSPAGTVVPGAGEFSWGPGLAPPGVERYRGREASDTLTSAPRRKRTS